MNYSKPWNNKLSKVPAILENLFFLACDSEKKIILGSKYALDQVYPDGLIVMVGTDTSGELHLGHAALLCIAESIKNVLGGKLVVSLNELESVYSRKSDLQSVYQNQKHILNTLKKYNCLTHSRVGDIDLMLFSARLWELLYEKQNSGIFRQYEEIPDMHDTFSIAIMAATPLILSISERVNSVLLLYGIDEFAHVDLIQSLYQSQWFIDEVKRNFGRDIPKINYLLIHNLPDSTGNYKMSKTRKKTTVFLNQIGTKSCHLKKASITYLENVLLVAKKMSKRQNKNHWYKLINNLV